MLQDLRVASPCSADWEEMIGSERIRFCLACEKSVYDLSAMTADEAEALLAANMGGEVCVRFYERADGTVMTSDCPVGATRKRRKKLALAIAGAGAMAAAALRIDVAREAPIAREPEVPTSMTREVVPLRGSTFTRARPALPPTTTTGGTAGPAPQPQRPPQRMMGAVAVRRDP
jgi:hypothetical protein